MYETCIDGLSFNAAHYTHVGNRRILHGHTFRVKICLKGKGKDYVIDFLLLKNIANSIIEELDYTLIIPKEHLGKVKIEAPVKVVINEYAIDGEPTAENIAKHICFKLINLLKLKNVDISNINEITVKVWESADFHGGFSIKVKDINY